MESANNWIYFKQKLSYERQITLLENCPTSRANKELIMRFLNNLIAKGDSSQTLRRILIYVRQFAILLNTEYSTATKEQIEATISKIRMDLTISDATKSGYIKVIKQFYHWYKKYDLRLEDIDTDLPKELRDSRKITKKEAIAVYDYIFDELKAGYKLHQIEPDQVITDTDLALLIEKGCQNAKERAIISVLHESGARVGEFLNLKIKSIDQYSNPPKITLNGKTGMRVVVIYNSWPYLMRYLENHLDKNNPDSYLWLCEDHSRKGQPLKYLGLRKLLNRVKIRSKFTKKFNCHWFRHSRASIFQSKITEPVLRKYMGWAKDSNMLKHYGHLNDDQVNNAIMTAKGLVIDQKEEQKVIKCPMCSTQNPSTETYCFKCSRPLRVETMMQDQERVQKEIQDAVKAYMAEMMKRENKTT